MNLNVEKYIEVRKAQAQGVRTIDDLKNFCDIAIESEEEKSQIESVLKQACRCNDILVKDVVKAVENGADTLEKVMEATSAGTVCGRCKGILSNIIENKR